MVELESEDNFDGEAKGDTTNEDIGEDLVADDLAADVSFAEAGTWRT